jgi:hypothetical protein
MAPYGRDTASELPEPVLIGVGCNHDRWGVDRGLTRADTTASYFKDRRSFVDGDADVLHRACEAANQSMRVEERARTISEEGKDRRGSENHSRRVAFNEGEIIFLANLGGGLEILFETTNLRLVGCDFEIADVLVLRVDPFVPAEAADVLDGTHQLMP